jgi:phage terminase Nu1 subunit (DNA packaging protein)
MADEANPSNYGIGRGSGPIATTSSLASVLSLTKTRIGQLVEEGVLVKLERGKFPLCDSVNRYVNYLRNQPKNQWGAKGEDETDFDRERLRRTKEEADKLEIFNARSRGELVEIEKVKRSGEKVMSAIKTRILNMPLSEDEKDQCLRDLVSLKEMDFSDE